MIQYTKFFQLSGITSNKIYMISYIIFKEQYYFFILFHKPN